MTSSEPAITGRVPFSGRDTPAESLINACVHCGLCLSSCPTYRETGLEQYSPRGRIYLMKSVAEGRIGLDSAVFQEQMDACLNCRACEAVCPSGVQYGQILEASRAQIETARLSEQLPAHSLPARLVRGAVFDGMFRRMELFRIFSRLMWLYQRSGVQWLARRLGILRLFGLEATEQLLPPISDMFVVAEGQIHRASGSRRQTVGLLTGCIMATSFADVHAATIRVLQKNGCDVILVPDQGCCGALHAHGGDLEGARDLARRNIAAFAGLGLDAIITNAAGCGSTLKEYHHLLHDDPTWAQPAERFSAMVYDISEFLVQIGLNTAELHHLPLTVTYQEPCHLAHAQRISAQPRRLLQAIPGLELREMHESSLCCGSAGIYNVTQPAMAARLGNRKLDNAAATGAQVVVTANPGCHLQLAGGLQARGSGMHVRHVVELLDEAYQA
ncbi:MAG TPA: heterodisulfide reductase-related iron-sulfur binding cluster [Roseiflexaceae bacterium]|nr:heterodisulfide reductase-related iron-sulfur binding cluster [Roseiflexaceae bacterium]HMP41188.1 heterodisulfide reductase-related iron-sulfur binding cluster [Roseiflexaceae bacterium]